MIRKVLTAMAKKFFMRQTSMDKLLEQVQSLEKKIDLLSQAPVKTETTAVYGVVPTAAPVASITPSTTEEEPAPLYIPKARLGEASIKKVKTTVESHDSEDVEKLKRKRKSS